MARDTRWLQHVGLLGLIAASLPVGLLIETALVRVFATPDFNEMRAELGPSLATFAWCTVVLTGLCTLAGLLARRRLVAHLLEKLGPHRDNPQRREQAVVTALLIATSIAQGPALLATLAALVGAPGRPVHLAVWIASAGVLLIGADGLHRARGIPSGGGNR